MLDAEIDLHAKSGALFNSKRLLLESFQGAGFADINDDIISTLDLQSY
jgi:hypothetical protein